MADGYPHPRNPRSAVRNAADRDQVTRAERIERDRDDTSRRALQVVLAHPEGRMVLWDLLRRAGVYRSVWDQSSRIHYNAGRQDFGHELLALCLQADDRLYLLMEQEGRERAAHEQRTLSARPPRTNGSTEEQTDG